MNGWTEDDATDIRIRDLAERGRTIMGGGYVWPAEYPPQTRTTLTVPDDGNEYRLVRQAHAYPRRIDWYRVAALTIVILAACAASVALVASLVLFLTAF